MHKKLNNGLTFCLIGNICFVIFCIICLAYYKFFAGKGIIIRSFEAAAYFFEAAGFIAMLAGIILISVSMRMRTWIKLTFPVYIIAELVLMILELNSYRFEFYHPYSLLLAICHAVLSAAVCFTFISLDSGKKCLEVTIIIAVGIMLAGMLGNIIGYRIYFSILTNAVAYIFLFAAVKWMLSREMIEIDCHGDKARVVEYRSEFFGK